MGNGWVDLESMTIAEIRAYQEAKRKRKTEYRAAWAAANPDKVAGYEKARRSNRR